MAEQMMRLMPAPAEQDSGNHEHPEKPDVETERCLPGLFEPANLNAYPPPESPLPLAGLTNVTWVLHSSYTLLPLSEMFPPTVKFAVGPGWESRGHRRHTAADAHCKLQSNYKKIP